MAKEGKMKMDMVTRIAKAMAKRKTKATARRKMKTMTRGATP